MREHKAERHARGFTCWGQFVAMLFCPLAGAQSLREICGGLAASEGKLRQQLFVYRDLWLWIDEPFQPPPMLTGAAQQMLLLCVNQLGQHQGQPQPANDGHGMKTPQISLSHKPGSG